MLCVFVCLSSALTPRAIRAMFGRRDRCVSVVRVGPGRVAVVVVWCTLQNCSISVGLWLNVLGAVMLLTWRCLYRLLLLWKAGTLSLVDSLVLASMMTWLGVWFGLWWDVGAIATLVRITCSGCGGERSAMCLERAAGGGP